ncbi:MAG: hypothetical protein WCV50_04530 [Patescibacteria group bacterium]
MKKINFRLIFLFAFVVVGTLLLGNGAQAVTLIPPSLEIGLKPGAEYDTVIKLFNETSNTISLYTEVTNFSAKGETGQPEFDFGGELIGLAKWINVEKGPIVIEPGKRYEVPVAIKTPVDADPGGHYATLFFSSSPPEEGQLRIASKVGTLILARVDGEIKEAGSITEFSASKKTFSSLPVEFTIRFSNSGNVHLKPTGKIAVKNIFGKETVSIDFNASKGATLPNTVRMYQATWDKGLIIDKSGNVWSDFWQGYSNEKNNFALGKYTAELSITAGTLESVKDTAKVGFWVLPWHMMLVWGLLAVLAVLLIIFLIKKYNAWILKKAKSQQ